MLKGKTRTRGRVVTDSEISILLETSDRLTEGTETDFHLRGE